MLPRSEFGWQRPLRALVLGLAVGALLTFLGWQARGIDLVSNNSIRGHLAALRELPPQIDRELLVQRYEVLPDYDRIATMINEVEAQMRGLQDSLDAAGFSSSDAVTLAARQLQAQLQLRGALVEDFKSHNSVLKNSLNYIVHYTDDVYSGRRPMDSAMRLRIQELQREILLQHLTRVDGSKHLGSEIDEFSALIRASSSDPEPGLTLLLDHARMLVNLEQDLTGLIDRAQQITGAESMLDAAYNRYVDSVSARTALYRHLLLWLASAMLTFAGWSFWRLARSRARLDSALHEVEFQRFALDQHAIVSIADRRGNITYINDHFVDISGYARDELIGKNHRIVKSDVLPPEFYREMWRTIANGRVWHGEIVNRSKQGSDYWVAATIVPFLNAAGKPERYVSIRTDITERKRHEVELQRAREVADEASRAKSMFLANMSHEIRTPMNAIIGMSYLALQTRLSKLQHDYVNQIHESGNALLGIINDILDFSKVEAGKMNIESVACEPAVIVARAVALIAAKAEAKGLSIEVKLAPDLPPVIESDPLRLGQILTNLLSNALKFTEHGCIRLAAELADPTEPLEPADPARRKAADRMLRFTVSDSGIGMTPEQQTRLFQAFSQADGSTTRRFGGTGLGLSISQRLVELLGGQITVLSTAGQGSTFSFTVRCRIGRAEAIESRPEALPNGDLGGLRVLLAEDNAINRLLACELIERRGGLVEVVEDGQQAVDKILAHADFLPWDVVLMDVQMPVLDGIEATRRLRREPRCARLPILAMTAHAFAEEREHCLAAGMNDHLSKPVQPEALYAALLHWSGRDKIGAAPQPSDAERAAAPEGDELPALPGFDVAAALANIDGDHALYLELLRMFRQQQAQDQAALQQAMDTGDRATAERLAHSTGSVAASLGLTGLSHLAKTLENKLRGAGDVPEGLLDDLLAAGNAAIATLDDAGIDSTEPVTSTATRAIVEDTAAVAGALARLRQLLVTQDGEAIDFFDENAASFARVLTAPATNALRQCLNRFDFAGALAQLPKETR